PEVRPRDAGVVAHELTAYLASAQERLQTAELARARAEAKAAQERKARRLTVALAASVHGTALVAGAGWLVMERQQVERRETTAGQVNRMIDEALRLHTEAGTAPAGAMAPWTAAVEAAKRAQAALDAGTGDDETHRRVRDLLAELDDEVAAAQRAAAQADRDRRMVARLAEIRLRPAETKDGHLNYERAHRDYQAVFQEHGLDVEARPPAEVAAGMRASAIHADLVAALDDWALVRLSMPKPDHPGLQRLVEVLRAADPDPL